MNNDENEKPAEKDAGAQDKQALRPRRIVRSASTARAEAEAAAKVEADAANAPPKPAAAAGRPQTIKAEPSKVAAVVGEAGQAGDPGAARPAPERRVFDARAPKPRPAPSSPAPAWSPVEGSRPVRGPIDASSRAPGAIPRPVRGPIDASSRAPGAIPRTGAPRFQRGGGAPRPPRERNGFEGRERSSGFEGGRGDRRPRPGGDSRPQQAPPPAQAARPAPQTMKPVAPPAPQHQARAAHKPPLMPLPFARNVMAPTKSNKPALTAKEVLSAKAKAATASSKAKPAESAVKPAAAADFAADIVNVSGEAAKEAILGVGANAEALVERWIAASNADAIAAVADAEEVPSAARKAARRALNVLKARGVAISTRAHVARFTDEGPSSLEATFLPPDATGTSAITVASREASGRYHIAEVIARDGVGILHAGSAWLSGTQLKESRSRAENAVGMAPVAVPVEWARHRIAAARERNAVSRQIVPLGFDRCRELVEPVPPTPPAHPVADLEAGVTSEIASARAPGSATLHGELEFRSWLPDQGAIAEMLQKLGENLGPEGLKDGDKVNAAMTEEMSAATDRFFTPELRAVIAQRMRDAAISVRSRKGDARAVDVLAIARAIEEAGLITSPPREIPFLVLFFQKAISYMAQQSGGQIRIPVPAGAPSEVPAGA